ncbi:FK506 binding protein proline rotamase rapamycin-binding protein [Lobosporangium transversale]|uniref:peptidylprolyl isomerase n=1 Tax=Lobosporangium transversale TaxID=64571 RepID=A0A1Y2GPR0_9FUNG|nr:peptidyl-prolyl cis-trans isomerase [Lobosporangium transversale]KAF9898253.1 FK506 binding protein proline rotamase rapamycin-binding protein [Lobosporangium transversale]ORZ18272.1 peptidyl-prolyl cis-trans isomerase [Lobosporangium transversale]|eukprot:XP_021882067.1 peptidyl-prolyl cis-trans isomerase [Lobosporangium transversale]
MGVTKKTITPGDGINFPKAGQTVVIHYTGTLENGRKFDSSRDRGEPFVTQIGVGRVIKGWDKGVPLMSVGERAILHITYDHAYGARGMPPVIPGLSNLIFDVELLEIRD